MEESQIFYDLTHPSICESPERVRKVVKVHKDAYSATKGTHAIVICTEWDEFAVYFNANLQFISETLKIVFSGPGLQPHLRGNDEARVHIRRAQNTEPRRFAQVRL